jgi:hypothetical protein
MYVCKNRMMFRVPSLNITLEAGRDGLTPCVETLLAPDVRFALGNSMLEKYHVVLYVVGGISDY